MTVELIKDFYFEAAHRNTRIAGPGAQLHGHSFRVEIVVEGPVDPQYGWLIDYGDIKQAFQPLHDQLDHHFLNEIAGLENGAIGDVAQWTRERLAPRLPGLKDVRVTVVGDNELLLVELPPDPERDLPPRLRFTFEAAQQLPHLAPGHPCRRLHGHSYRVEVGAGDLAPLHELLEGVYDALDHRYLNDIPGLEMATSERLCVWIWDWLARHVDDLRAVVVQETASARCIYRGK